MFDFFNTTRLCRDTVTVYDAPSTESWAGGILGGTTVVAGTVAALIAPLTYSERVQVLGAFPDTTARLYVGTAIALAQGASVEVNYSVTYGTGTMFVIEGSPQFFMEPFTDRAMYQTAWLSKVQR